MFLIPFIIVLVISIGASLVASKRGGDFFLANRSIRWPLLLGTFVGTQVGGGFILGNTDASWKLGICGSMYGLGLALGMLGLGLGFGAKLRRLNIRTFPELLEKRYGSVWLKNAAAVVSILSLAGILMCQAIGLRKFLQAMNVSSDLIYVLSWGTVVFYTTCGGLLAVVWTDVIQAIVMVAMLVVTLCGALLPQWSTICDQAVTMGCSFDRSVLASLIIPLCFIFIEQDMAQRCFAAKSPSDATKGCLFTALVLIALSAIPTMCGLLGKAMGLSPDNGAIFLQVMQRVSNPFVFVMSSSAVLLAIISTASAVLLALSSNVAQDMTFSKRNWRLVTLVLGIGALFGPYMSSDIISWMVGSYEISVGALFVPIMWAVFTKKPFLPKQAGWGAALAGSVGTLIARSLPANPLAVAIPFVLSLIGFAVGWALGSKSLVTAEQTVGNDDTL